MAAGATPFNKDKVSIRFPTELGSAEVPNYITFRPEAVDFGTSKGQSTKENYGNPFTRQDFVTANRTTGTNAIRANISNGTSIVVHNPFEVLSKQIGGVVDSVANNVKLAFEGFKNGNVQFDLNAAPGGGINVAGRLNLGSVGINLSNGNTQSPNTITSLGGLHLYLPSELKSGLNVSYNEASAGASGQFALDFAGNSYSGAGEFLTKNATNLAATVLQDVLSDQMSTVIQRGTGRAKNNYTYAIFNGVKHREFSYSFRLIAKNEEESIKIKKICDYFMFYMLPVKSQDSFHFYDIPPMWDISYRSFYLKGEKIPYFDQPNKCFLTSVDISYGKDAFGHTYVDGAPATVDLSLKYMEIEPLLRDDPDVIDTDVKLWNQVKGLFQDPVGKKT